MDRRYGPDDRHLESTDGEQGIAGQKTSASMNTSGGKCCPGCGARHHKQQDSEAKGIRAPGSRRRPEVRPSFFARLARLSAGQSGPAPPQAAGAPTDQGGGERQPQRGVGVSLALHSPTGLSITGRHCAKPARSQRAPELTCAPPAPDSRPAPVWGFFAPPHPGGQAGAITAWAAVSSTSPGSTGTDQAIGPWMADGQGHSCSSERLVVQGSVLIGVGHIRPPAQGGWAPPARADAPAAPQPPLLAASPEAGAGASKARRCSRSQWRGEGTALVRTPRSGAAVGPLDSQTPDLEGRQRGQLAGSPTTTRRVGKGMGRLAGPISSSWHSTHRGPHRSAQAQVVRGPQPSSSVVASQTSRPPWRPQIQPQQAVQTVGGMPGARKPLRSR